MVVLHGYTGNGERQRSALLTRSLREVAFRDFSWELFLGRIDDSIRVDSTLAKDVAREKGNGNALLPEIA